jgi:heme-degrading monooxygenase HmoA
MFALAGVFHGAPEHLDEDAIRHAREQTLLLLQRQPGFGGLHILADRQTGNTLAFSFWETEAALPAWEQMRGPIVAEQTAPTGRTEQEGGNYEVVFSSEGT